MSKGGFGTLFSNFEKKIFPGQKENEIPPFFSLLHATIVWDNADGCQICH